MIEGFDVWKLLAGLGIFIFGMFLMEESIKNLSGRAFKKLIRVSTTGKVKSIFSGVFVTAVLQSSSAVSLMILAFVGAGIMSVENAIGVVLGSNVGTTITGWIVATIGFKLDIESFALPLIGTGGLGIIFLGQSERYSNISKLLVGFGFLFMGLDYMKGSVEVFADTFDLTTIPDYGLLVYLGIGVILTAIMQSSSATIAITLTALNAGMLSFDASAAMIIGANIGTTITIFLGAIGGTPVKKRVAFSHLIYNLVTGIGAFLLMPVLVFIVLQIIDINNNAVIALALFHTLFNVLGVLAFMPFIHLLAKFLNKTFPDKRAELTIYLNSTNFNVPVAVITSLKKESLHLVKETIIYNLNTLNLEQKLVLPNYISNNSPEKGKQFTLPEKYDNLKRLQSEIFTFATKIESQKLSEEESKELHQYLHGARMALHSAKTLKDIIHDFDDFASSDNTFLNDQHAQFKKRLIETYLKINALIENGDKDKTKAILKILKAIKSDDRKFVRLTTQAINNKQIEDISVSTALIVNRAFVQSSKQILLAIRELMLNQDEILIFDRAQDISDSLMEQE